MKAQADADKKTLIKEWSTKLNETVKSVREQEQSKAKEILDRHKEDFMNQMSDL